MVRALKQRGVFLWLCMAWLLGLAAPSTHAAQAPRIALVIGNAAYQDVGTLRNPVNDATDVAAALEQLGFVVQRHVNLGRNPFNDAIGTFLKQAEGAELVIVYYSGHGMQTGGETFLLPTDVRIQNERDLRNGGMRLSELMDDLEKSQIRNTLLILDACRDNPYRTRTKSASRGLAPPKEMNSAFMVAYATADGKTADDGEGRNGTYTTQLLNQLKQPGKSLRDIVEDTQLAVEQTTKGEQRPKTYGDTAKFRNLMLASMKREDEKNLEIESNKKGWAQWQGMMKADFDRANGIGDSVLRAKALVRFLEVYKQENPWSVEDDELRAQAQVAVQPVQTPQPAKPGQVFKDCQQAHCPELVVLPGGSFLMGSNDGESYEFPLHRVNIRSFVIGKYEVTQGQWKAVMGSNPSRFSDCGDNCPVENVSWDDVQQFIQKLNRITGQQYRLPSETEWEYAAKAGSNNRYSWGNAIGRNNANCNGCGSQWDNKSTAPVGSFNANKFGLHDMHGNVWEWVQDPMHTNYNEAPTDNRVWQQGGNDSYRMLRGGSWDESPLILRTTNRFTDSVDHRDIYNGFRLARTVP